MNEATYWRQRYEMLMANISDMAKLSGAKSPVLLADKESYEAGRIAGKAEQPAREWVGLTDEERACVYRSIPSREFCVNAVAAAIEAKLREKNNG